MAMHLEIVIGKLSLSTNETKEKKTCQVVDSLYALLSRLPVQFGLIYYICFGLFIRV
jgi:hypothetical protein